MWDSRFHLPDCQTHQRWSAGFPGPLLWRWTLRAGHVHTHGEGFRGQQDLPASVQNISQTGQKAKEKPWKKHHCRRCDEDPSWNKLKLKFDWRSTGRADTSPRENMISTAWRGGKGPVWLKRCASKNKPLPVYLVIPEKMQTCQGRPTVLSRYHHTSFNNPAILYHEALRK